MVTQLPLITIITVVYNGAAHIEDTITSVLNNSYSNLEYIVIDGGSRDDTVDIIKRYASKIKYWISEPDKGIYDAMNKGWAKADDDSFVLYLGAGDRIVHLPDMSKHKEDDIIYGRVDIAGRYMFDTKIDFRMKLINGAHHQGLLIRKGVHPQPPFLLQFPVFADFDFNQRLYKSGFRFIKDGSFDAYAMEAGTSSPHNKKEMLQVVKHNYGAMYVLIARLYYFLQNIKNSVTRFSP